MRPGAWSGYAAATCAFAFAVPSLYWGLGGKFGAGTVAAEATRLNWSQDPLVMAVVLVTGLLKVFGGLFAIALVRPSWPRARRWIMLTAGWTASVLLVAYGGLYEIGQALVAAHVIAVPADFDWRALHWHLYLWSPWFLVWGVLLGLAVLRYQSAGTAHRSASEQAASRRNDAG